MVYWWYIGAYETSNTPKINKCVDVIKTYKYRSSSMGNLLRLKSKPTKDVLDSSLLCHNLDDWCCPPPLSRLGTGTARAQAVAELNFWPLNSASLWNRELK